MGHKYQFAFRESEHIRGYNSNFDLMHAKQKANEIAETFYMTAPNAVYCIRFLFYECLYD